MDLGLHKKVVVVTGGASGIGSAIVHGLISEGAVPVVIDKNSEKLDILRREYAALVDTEKVITHLCDLSDPLDTQRVISELNMRHTDIYGLVNNAGTNDGVGITSDVSGFMTSLQKNLVHYFHVTHGLIDKIKQSQGSIVNISSKVSVTGQGGTSGYAAAKGAINALTREWAVDFAPSGVRVNAVIPAEVATPQYDSWISDPRNLDRFESIKKKINLGKRLTTSKEVADAVLFLLSTRSSHSTGQLVFVDGGYTHLDDSGS